jgi:hypothetical protein
VFSRPGNGQRGLSASVPCQGDFFRGMNPAYQLWEKKGEVLAGSPLWLWYLFFFQRVQARVSKAADHASRPIVKTREFTVYVVDRV